MRLRGSIRFLRARGPSELGADLEPVEVGAIRVGTIALLAGRLDEHAGVDQELDGAARRRLACLHELHWPRRRPRPRAPPRAAMFRAAPSLRARSAIASRSSSVISSVPTTPGPCRAGPPRGVDSPPFAAPRSAGLLSRSRQASAVPLVATARFNHGSGSRLVVDAIEARVDQPAVPFRAMAVMTQTRRTDRNRSITAGDRSSAAMVENDGVSST
jgi:hypothetical protein